VQAGQAWNQQNAEPGTPAATFRPAGTTAKELEIAGEVKKTQATGMGDYHRAQADLVNKQLEDQARQDRGTAFDRTFKGLYPAIPKEGPAYTDYMAAKDLAMQGDKNAMEHWKDSIRFRSYVDTLPRATRNILATYPPDFQRKYILDTLNNQPKVTVPPASQVVPPQQQGPAGVGLEHPNDTRMRERAAQEPKFRSFADLEGAALRP
jgi:hypothetical protein